MVLGVVQQAWNLLHGRAACCLEQEKEVKRGGSLSSGASAPLRCHRQSACLPDSHGCCKFDAVPHYSGGSSSRIFRNTNVATPPSRPRPPHRHCQWTQDDLLLIGRDSACGVCLLPRLVVLFARNSSCGPRQDEQNRSNSAALLRFPFPYLLYTPRKNT